MPSAPISDEEAARRYALYEDYNFNAQAAGKSIGKDHKFILRGVDEYRKRGLGGIDPVIHDAVIAGGIKDPANLKHGWKIVKDENGNGYSLFFKNPNASGDDEEVSLTDLVRESIAEGIEKRPKFEKRNHDKIGEHLLVIDLADIHFLKLCVETETGYTYNRDVARHRVIEGTKALLRTAQKGYGIHRILFVLGNDILHVDNKKGTTTNGTFQDTDGTIKQGFKDARMALSDAILQCTKVANVDLIHCMSNHDELMGWALSQTVAALFEAHPNVNATDYNLSERDRKYYRYGSTLIGVTHGHGAKEENLSALMLKEARIHMSECLYLYWLMHHFHHKIRKKRGIDKPFLMEKDHISMSVTHLGEPRVEGEGAEIEYVRSPSPPDSWHDRSGYVNRQAVECFIYHADKGQVGRFTEWF